MPTLKAADLSGKQGSEDWQDHMRCLALTQRTERPQDNHPVPSTSRFWILQQDPHFKKKICKLKQPIKKVVMARPWKPFHVRKR
jgi:hypothetical protein